MKEVVDFIILILLYIFIFHKKWKTKGKDILFINTTMYIYLSFVLYTFLLSLGIEILQPLINGFRSSDIIDLITNVLGGIVGYIMYLIFKPLTIKILNHIKNK